MADQKKGKGTPVVETYTDEQYKKAKEQGHVIIDRRGMTQYEKLGKSEPIEIPGLTDAGDDE